MILFSLVSMIYILHMFNFFNYIIKIYYTIFSELEQLVSLNFSIYFLKEG